MKRFGLSAIIAVLTAMNCISAFSQNPDSIRPVDSIPGSKAVFRQIDSTLTSGESGSEKAYELYDFFVDSPIMGDENYAVYIAEKYILPSEDSRDKTFIKLFARLNRLSLVGLPAQELRLKNKEYQDITILQNSSPKYRIVFFYDIDCPRCAAEIKILKSLSDKMPPMLTEFDAVYTGSEMNRWIEYSGTEFPDSDNRINLFDPEMSSGFIGRYGVIKTPSTFIIDEDGFIIGKNIEAMDIPMLIDENIQIRKSVETYVNDIYEAAEPETYEDAVYFSEKMVRQADEDNQLFRIIVTSLYNRFKSADRYEFSETADYIARNFILEQPWKWSRAFIEATDMAIRKYSQNKLGCQAEDLSLKDKDGNTLTLSSLADHYGQKVEHIVLYFFTPDCAICAATTMELIDAATKSEDTLFAFIYAGADYESFIDYITPSMLRKNIVLLENCENSGEMFDLYDLSFVPSIYLLDKDRTILAKDITPFTLKDLLM